ncbi:unnamed protein product [Paramecium octaurelia]|uniref:Uncharacterized protein n=1 Tax=Paramecium octaurelia TaxID=43137 RepID=A0A8S1UE53_PAROT|nr:unnamed protein product [Paramecium octaurelia]
MLQYPRFLQIHIQVFQISSSFSFLPLFNIFNSFPLDKITSISIIQILKSFLQHHHLKSILAIINQIIIKQLLTKLQLLMLQSQIPIRYSSFQTLVQSSKQQYISSKVQLQDYKTSLTNFIEVGITVISNLPHCNPYDSQFKDFRQKGSVSSSYAVIIQLKEIRYFSLQIQYAITSTLSFFQIQNIIGQKIIFIQANKPGTSIIIILPYNF